MEYLRLGKTELTVTKPSMGCLPLQRCTVDEAVDLLRAAYDGGIRFFDTANAYTDSEKKLGLALADVRGDIVIATKSGASDYDGVLRHVENSLKMLKTDHVDLLQLHNPDEFPDPDDPKGAYQGALEAKRRGWTNHVGITAHRLSVAKQAIESGLYETLQFPFSYISAPEDLALAEACKQADMGFIAMKGLAGGLLTNAAACHAFMGQYDNVVPIWGIQRPEELAEWLAVAEENPVMDDKLRAVIEADRAALDKLANADSDRQAERQRIRSLRFGVPYYRDVFSGRFSTDTLTVFVDSTDHRLKILPAQRDTMFRGPIILTGDER